MSKAAKNSTASENVTGTTGASHECAISPRQTTRRDAIKASALAILCVAGCLALPVAIGAASAIGGLLAGRPWIVALAAALTAVTVIVVRRRRNNSIC